MDLPQKCKGDVSKFPNDINAQITYAVTLQQTDNQRSLNI